MLSWFRRCVYECCLTKVDIKVQAPWGFSVGEVQKVLGNMGGVSTKGDLEVQALGVYSGVEVLKVLVDMEEYELKRCWWSCRL